MKLLGAIEAFLDAKQTQYSYNTLYNYGVDFRQLSEFLGDVEMSDVGLSDILAWRAFHGYSDRSWHRKVKSVRALFRWLLQRNILTENPVADYMPVVPDDRQVEALTDSEVKALQEFKPDHPREYRARVIAYLCLDGLQIGQILSLTTNELNLDLGIMGIGNELVPLSPLTVEAIREWLSIRLEKGPQIALMTSLRGKPGINRDCAYRDLAHLGKMIFGQRGKLTVRVLHATFLASLVGGMPGADLKELATASGRDLRRIYSIMEEWG